MKKQINRLQTKGEKMGKKIDHYIFLTSSEAGRYTPEAIKEGVLPHLSGEKCELGWRCPSAVCEDGTKSKLDNATCWHHKSYKMGVSKDGEYLWRETLQSRDNMLALCSACHGDLHSKAKKHPDKYSHLCPTMDDFVKAKKIIFFDCDNPPRKDLLNAKEVRDIFGVNSYSLSGISDKLKKNGFNTYKMRFPMSGKESVNSRNFYSKSDLLKCGLKEKIKLSNGSSGERKIYWENKALQAERLHEATERILMREVKRSKEISRKTACEIWALHKDNNELKKIIQLKEETIEWQQKHIEELGKIIDEYNEMIERSVKSKNKVSGLINRLVGRVREIEMPHIELPLPGQAGA